MNIYSPFLINSQKSDNFSYYNNVKYETPQLGEGNLMRLLQFQMSDIYLCSGILQVDGHVFQGQNRYTDINAFVQDLNTFFTDNAIQIAASISAISGKYFIILTAQIAMIFESVFIISGNLRNLLGCDATFTIQPNQILNLSTNTPFNIQYIQLRCLQLEAQQMLLQSEQVVVTNGIILMLFPQITQTYYQKANSFNFSIISQQSPMFELLDQNNNAVEFGQFFIQIHSFPKASIREQDLHLKRMSFLVLSQQSTVVTLFNQYDWIAINQCQSFLFDDNVNTVQSSVLQVKCDQNKDILLQGIHYNNYFVSPIENATFLWKAITGNNIVFNITQINTYIDSINVFHPNEVVPFNGIMILQIYYK